jgi:hypothetical protein
LPEIGVFKWFLLGVFGLLHNWNEVNTVYVAYKEFPEHIYDDFCTILLIDCGDIETVIVGLNCSLFLS